MKSGISKLNDIGDKDDFDKQIFKAFESTN